jgi:hypothetical protein
MLGFTRPGKLTFIDGLPFLKMGGFSTYLLVICLIEIDGVYRSGKNGWIFYSELLVYPRVSMDIGKSEFQASYIYIWAVVSNMNFIFHFIYGMSSFPLTNSYFSRWLKPPTRHS